MHVASALSNKTPIKPNTQFECKALVYPDESILMWRADKAGNLILIRGTNAEIAPMYAYFV